MENKKIALDTLIENQLFLKVSVGETKVKTPLEFRCLTDGPHGLLTFEISAKSTKNAYKQAVEGLAEGEVLCRLEQWNGEGWVDVEVKRDIDFDLTIAGILGFLGLALAVLALLA